MSGCARKVTFGSLWVDCSCMLSAKLPALVYGAADMMSDKAAVMRLSQPCLQRSCLPQGIMHHGQQGFRETPALRKRIRSVLPPGHAHVLHNGASSARSGRAT